MKCPLDEMWPHVSQFMSKGLAKHSFDVFFFYTPRGRGVARGPQFMSLTGVMKCVPAKF